MKATLVLTLIGVDRPGLVKAISNVASRHGANWEASRMARLGGKFAGLLLVTLEPARAEALRRDLEALSEHGASWERSQMARLAGKFAGIVEVSVPSAHADGLLRADVVPILAA